MRPPLRPSRRIPHASRRRVVDPAEQLVGNPDRVDADGFDQQRDLAEIGPPWGDALGPELPEWQHDANLEPPHEALRSVRHAV
jgi:hypothetical protein